KVLICNAAEKRNLNSIYYMKRNIMSVQQNDVTATAHSEDTVSVASADVFNQTSPFQAGFKSPFSFILASVSMLVGCGTAAYLSMFAFARISPQALQLFVTIAIAIISVFLGATALSMVIAGGIRWALASRPS